MARKTRLLQTPAEIAARNEALAESLVGLIENYALSDVRRALDVGCQRGWVTDQLVDRTRFEWWGIDPVLEGTTESPRGAQLVSAWAHDTPFPDAFFDCVVFANVYEHLKPSLRLATLRELARILDPRGVLVGQLPNPYHFIESHSRLPFLGWLPHPLQLLYWRLSPVSWPHDFYTVTIRDVRRRALEAGFAPIFIRGFNYPPEALPSAVRPLARRLSRLLDFFPWSWQFVFRKAEAPLSGPCCERR